MKQPTQVAGFDLIASGRFWLIGDTDPNRFVRKQILDRRRRESATDQVPYHASVVPKSAVGEPVAVSFR
jgi:hypothetical protein